MPPQARGVCTRNRPRRYPRRGRRPGGLRRAGGSASHTSRFTRDASARTHSRTGAAARSSGRSAYREHAIRNQLGNDELRKVMSLFQVHIQPGVEGACLGHIPELARTSPVEELGHIPGKQARLSARCRFGARPRLN